MRLLGSKVSKEVALGLGFECEGFGPLRYRVAADARAYLLELHLSDDYVARVDRYSVTVGSRHAPPSSSLEPIARFPSSVNDTLNRVLGLLLAESKLAVRGEELARKDPASRSDSAVLKHLRTRVSKPAALKVRRDQAGRVTAIRIDDWWGDVDLPGEIGHLSELTDLEFAPCTLKRIPRELGVLRKLRRLSVFQCNLRSLPDEIGHLELLEELCVAGNRFRGFPSAVCRLRRLKRLWMHDCGLRDIPPQIGNLTALTDLSLGGNKLRHLPRAIEKLQALTILRLGNNGLEALPTEIGSLSALTHLDLSSNHLERLPRSLAGLKRLAQLSVERNRLRAVPLHVLALPLLSYVDLNGNPIVRWPSSVRRVGNSAWKVLSAEA